jgi:hypothetical protein
MGSSKIPLMKMENLYPCEAGFHTPPAIIKPKMKALRAFPFGPMVVSPPSALWNLNLGSSLELGCRGLELSAGYHPINVLVPVLNSFP